MAQSKFLEQWVDHTGTRWAVYRIRTLLMLLMRVPAEYGVTRNDKFVYVASDLESAKKYIRDTLYTNHVQVPYYLLPIKERRFIDEAERSGKVYFGWSHLHQADCLDLIRYGWIAPNSGMSGNFRRVCGK